jgi:hypothetical protein
MTSFGVLCLTVPCAFTAASKARACKMLHAVVPNILTPPTFRIANAVSLTVPTSCRRLLLVRELWPPRPLYISSLPALFRFLSLSSPQIHPTPALTLLELLRITSFASSGLIRYQNLFKTRLFHLHPQPLYLAVRQQSTSHLPILCHHSLYPISVPSHHSNHHFDSFCLCSLSFLTQWSLLTRRRS